jgi:hypothetical protein
VAAVSPRRSGLVFARHRAGVGGTLASQIEVPSWTSVGTSPFGFSFRNSGFFVSPFWKSSFTRSQGVPSCSRARRVMLAVE